MKKTGIAFALFAVVLMTCAGRTRKCLAPNPHGDSRGRKPSRTLSTQTFPTHGISYFPPLTGCILFPLTSIA